MALILKLELRVRSSFRSWPEPDILARVAGQYGRGRIGLIRTPHEICSYRVHRSGFRAIGASTGSCDTRRRVDGVTLDGALLETLCSRL
jgi:hypothetical protein